MEPSSELDQLNSFVAENSKVYDLPYLESDINSKNVLEQALEQFQQWFSSLFARQGQALDAADVRKTFQIFIVILLLASLILLGIYLFRRFRSKGLKAPRSALNRQETQSVADFDLDSPSPVQPIDRWLRARWKKFLEANHERLSLTPREFHRKFGRLDVSTVERLNEAMFWPKANSLSHEDWELVFRKLESGHE